MYNKCMLYLLNWISFILIFSMFVLSFKKYLQKRNTYLLVWSIGLFIGATAVASFYIFLVYKSSIAFYIYYYLGGGLTPAVLGLGSMYLLGRKKLYTISLYLTIILSIIVLIYLIRSHIIYSNFDNLIRYFKGKISLNKSISPNGSGVLLLGSWVIPIAISNTLGSIELIGVALYSTIMSFKRRVFNKIFWGLLILTISVFLIASLSTIARLFSPIIFWPSMVIGWLVFFIGFMLL